MTKKLSEVQSHHARLHDKVQNAVKRRQSMAPMLLKKKSKSHLKHKRLSLAPAWNIHEDVIRNHSQPFVAITELTNFLKKA